MVEADLSLPTSDFDEQTVEGALPSSGQTKPNGPKKQKVPRHVFFLIVIAIIMTSFASIMIRFTGAEEDAAQLGMIAAEASVIAFWRLFFATIGMFLGAVFTRNLKEFKKIGPPMKVNIYIA